MFSMGIGAIPAARLKTTRRDASAEQVLFALGRHWAVAPALTRRDTSERLSTHGWQNVQLCTAAAAAGPHPKAEQLDDMQVR